MLPNLKESIVNFKNSIEAEQNGFTIDQDDGRNELLEQLKRDNVFRYVLILI